MNRFGGNISKVWLSEQGFRIGLRFTDLKQAVSHDIAPHCATSQTVPHLSARFGNIPKRQMLKIN
jgi:hypothetical protein